MQIRSTPWTEPCCLSKDHYAEPSDAFSNEKIALHLTTIYYVDYCTLDRIPTRRLGYGIPQHPEPVQGQWERRGTHAAMISVNTRLALRDSRTDLLPQQSVLLALTQQLSEEHPLLI